MFLKNKIGSFLPGIILLMTLQLQFKTVPAQEVSQADKNPRVADPTIFLDQGVYYLYGTGGGARDNGFKVFTSTDLKNWKDQGMVLSKQDNYGSKGFWAPQVFKQGGNYYMVYTASEHIALSVAGSPLGPFTQKAKIPLDSNHRMIDPFVWIDTDGKVYLYHVRLEQGNRIMVAELETDFSAIKALTLRPCIVAEAPWEDTWAAEWKVAEGPTIVRHGRYYYLIYSANDFRNPDYAVGYATSESPLGPWKKFEGNPLLSKKNIGFNGVGHGDLLADQEGRLWYVFHTHNSPESVSPRKTAIIQVRFEKQEGGQPDRLTVLAETFRFLERSGQ